MSLSRSVFVLLPGKKEEGDHYQLVQEEAALAAGSRLGLRVDVAYAPAFDQLRVLKRRLGAEHPVDAVVTEPSTLSTMDLVLRELQGRSGLVLLNAWGPSVEAAARSWGAHPFGSISTHHVQIGQIQGRQVQALIPRGGRVLCITGPMRSSAAQERFEGLRSALGPEVEIFDTQAGHWTESAGATAFSDWYRVFRAREWTVDVLAAQSDELAVGARRAIEAVGEPDRREAMLRAGLLGVDACPGYGKRLVDEGTLAGSIVTPSSTDLALEMLHRFWTEKKPFPPRSFTEARPYPEPRPA